MRKFVFVVIILAAVSLVVWLYPPQGPKGPVLNPKEVKEAGTYEECVKQGFPIRTSYPPVCVTKSGKALTQNIGNELELKDKIKITTPRPTEKVVSPLDIKGQARGTWFFEGQFKASVMDDKGNILGEGVMSTNGEWMTEKFVPYEGQISFADPKTDTGKLVLEKDNPSGDPAKLEQLIVPVKFK